MRQREEMITRLEWANEQLWKSGKCQQWFGQCDDGIKRVSEGVNGYLLQELLRASRHCDLAVVELFRKGMEGALVAVCKARLLVSGAAMLGELSRSGVGEPRSALQS